MSTPARPRSARRAARLFNITPRRAALFCAALSACAVLCASAGASAGGYTVAGGVGPLAATFSPTNTIPTPTITADTNGTGTSDQACPEEPLTLHANGATGATSYQWYKDGNPINGATASTYQATDAGTYTVTASAGGNTTQQSSGYVVQNPAPHSPFISIRNQPSTTTSIEVSQGTPVILDSDSTTGIQWWKDGHPILGAGSQSYTATTSGIYTAQLDALGCHSSFGRNITVTVDPYLSVNDVSKAEGSSGTSTFDFTVSLDLPAGPNGVGFDVSTSDGTATAGSDYVAVSSQHYTIAAGQSSTTVSVTVNGDTTPELDETFYVNVTNVTGAQVSKATGTGTIQNDDAVAAGQVVISEFRFRGPNGSQDEFIELSNQTDSDMTVTTTDGSEGWDLVANDPSNPAEPTIIFTVPNGTVIPARGHFLVTNSGGYSLGLYASPDLSGAATYTYDIPDNGGVALFNSSSTLDDTTRLDAAGCSASAGFYETTPLAPVTDGAPENIPAPPQFSYVRKMTSGRPQDTNNNSNDFMLVATRPELITSATAQLGAPGPENTASPVNLGDLIKSHLVDATKAVDVYPNRERNSDGLPYTDKQTPSSPDGNVVVVNNVVTPQTPYAHGWMAIRRHFVNKTGAKIVGLRFRVVDITANRSLAPMNNGTADLRAISSASVTVTSSDPTLCGALPSCGVTVQGLTVDQEGPMPQQRGGGFNTSLSVDLSDPANQIQPDKSIDVQFLLGVQETGMFRFFVIVEAITDVSPSADLGGSPAPASFNAAKRAGATTPKNTPGKGASVKGKQ